MEHSEQLEHGTCNTNNKSRSYAFTLNNYTKDEIGTLEQEFLEAAEYGMQEETGKDGTPHLQGFIRYKNPVSFNHVKKLLKRAHWEKAKSIKACRAYCSKEDTRTGRQWAPPKKLVCKDPLDGRVLHDWQADVLRVISAEADDRTILWYWEAKGNIGKTTLAKHICLHYDAIYVSGKAADMKYAIANMKIKPKIVIIDLTRSNEEYVSYEGIESIKNGIFFSGKYEGGMVMFDPPHVLCLANYPPQSHKLSADRWYIKEI